MTHSVSGDEPPHKDAPPAPKTAPDGSPSAPFSLGSTSPTTPNAPTPLDLAKPPLAPLGPSGQTAMKKYKEMLLFIATSLAQNASRESQAATQRIIETMKKMLADDSG